MDSGDNEVLQYQSQSKSTESIEKPASLKAGESFTEFGDSSCGEPLFTQHLLIDFTPNDDDNEYVQKKCCDFWNFMQSQPQIQNLMVFPEKNEYSKISDTSNYTSEACKHEVEDKPIPLDRTAVSMLEVVEGKGLIDRTFEAKLPQSMCSLGSREYKEQEDVTQQKKRTKSVSGSQGPNTRQHVAFATKPTPLKTMVRKMQEWDKNHPKSMEPPSHPPSLQHCIFPPNVHP
ncbi:uncharacterized protein LOC142975068 [Anticarsia gemmatalis]|uniref:uncharacterized protein LOC142975068 n=1 Tax=Anticarsia gemmatalis TaxID=129554 RepID=UPI003F75F0B4